MPKPYKTNSVSVHDWQTLQRKYERDIRVRRYLRTAREVGAILLLGVLLSWALLYFWPMVA